MTDRGWVRRLRSEPDGHVAACAVLGLIGLSTLLRMVLTTVAHSPVIFSDELGYTKLAVEIGRNGHFALFNKPGLSVSPLYPSLLAPIYALGASAPTAYTLTKLLNSALISLSVFPIYKIARFVLTRRSSLVVAALSTLTPLMFYSSFSMSENIAYPIAAGAAWATLAAIRAPSVRNDAVLLVMLVVATAARVQLLVLFPAALTAVVAVAIVGRHPLQALKRHALFFGALIAGLIVAGGAALAGRSVNSLFGVYADFGRQGRPNVGHFLHMLIQHFAETDLAVGVVPFIAALVAAAAFARRGFREPGLTFATVAVSTTLWLLMEVAYDAALYDGHGDLPRIHERFLIYVVPFFLVALIATIEIPESLASIRVYLAAVGFAALLPLVIPFHALVNQPSAVDTFGLQPLGHTHAGKVVAIPFAAPVAVAGAAVLGLLFVNVRRQLRALVILVLIPLLLISGQVLSRVNAGSVFARSRLPARTDWVDATRPRGAVVLLTGSGDPLSALETAYSNLSITRLYYLCGAVAGPEFGEEQATVAANGLLRGESGQIRAAYVVAPTGLGVKGRVIAENEPGREVLVALPRGRVRVSPAAPRCRR